MNFPQHAAYSESGVDWLGKVPRHWKLKRLKYVASLLTDKAEGRRNSVGLENIEGWTGRFVPTDSDFTGAGVEFDAGDVLFGKLRPYLAKVWLARFGGEAVGDFHVVRPASELRGSYLVYQMLNRDFISIVNGSTFGAKMPRVNWDFLANMQMTVPPPDEQDAISMFLDVETSKIDELVSKQRLLIDLLKEKRQAVISHAVTKGLNPHEALHPSGVRWLGDVPQHWALRKLGGCTTITRLAGAEYTAFWEVDDGGAIIALRGQNIRANKLDTTNCERISEELSQKLVRSRLFKGDVVYPCVGSIGNAALIQEDDKYHINQNIAKLTSDTDKLYSPFLAYFLNSVVALESALFLNTSDAQPSILVRNLRKVKVPLPPIDEQKEISKFLDEQTDECDSLVAKVERAIELLKERRNALIAAAVTGKIDVQSHALRQTA